MNNTEHVGLCIKLSIDIINSVIETEYTTTITTFLFYFGMRYNVNYGSIQKIYESTTIISYKILDTFKKYSL